MSKAKVDKNSLLKKFQTLSSSSICIQKTSKYLYQFYKSSDIIVDVWLQALKLANTDAAKVPLFYIANEMLQSKNYGNSHFKRSWKPHLIHSVEFIKDSSIVDKIRRILNIWIDRKVYDQSFIQDLITRISSVKRPARSEEICKKIIMNFDPEDAVEKVKELLHVENETTDIIKNLESSINFDEKLSKEAIKNLKDKTQSNIFSENLDNNINRLFQICSLLEEELKIREKTFEVMNDAEIYYETQETETLVVEDAYRRYGIQVAKTKEALEEHLDFLMEDSVPLDNIDDAPSPGKTPPYLYEAKSKKIPSPGNSPMSFEDALSPTQSMEMSDEDIPEEKSGYDKPYSPSNQIRSSKPLITEIKAKLSSTEALKLLTSVFSQSLAKKPQTDMNAKVNLQSDIFRNTLATSTKDDVKESNRTTNSDTVFADAFRLISNLTGLKNLGERTFKTESSKTPGTVIPILNSKASFKNVEECDTSKQSSFSINPSNSLNTNVTSNVPGFIFPDLRNTSFPPPLYNQHQHITNNQMFPIFSNTSVPPPPMPTFFNSIQSNATIPFNMMSMNRVDRPINQSPGSCTEDEDEGGATPTQDEPGLLNPAHPVNIFNKNVLPALTAGAVEINKQIQNAMNLSSNQFTLHNMMPGQKDIGNVPWGGIGGQFSFNNNNNNTNIQSNMNMPFSLMNQNPQMQPIFTPTSSNMSMGFGPPRAIRTKRPGVDSVSTQDGSAEGNILISDSMTSARTSSESDSSPTENQNGHFQSKLSKSISKKSDSEKKFH